MTANQSYIYSIEFTVEDIEFFEYPPDLPCPDEHDFLVRFQMKPEVVLEVTEDEHIDMLNCNEKAMKQILIPLNEAQLECDPKACITAYKILCPSDLVPIGCYNIFKLHCKLQEVKKKFDFSATSSAPASEIIKELVPLNNCDNQVVGSIHYSLLVTCCGPRFSCDAEMPKKNYFQTGTDDFGRIKGCTLKNNEATEKCILPVPKDDFDEYVAQVNGNALIVRVTKGQFVTRVTDKTCYQDNLTIRGCNQQVDFEFPNNFTCSNCKKKYGYCKCNGDSDLTDFQKKTSCAGNSYKNTRVLPVIRGNLKYPGKFEDQKVTFNVHDGCTPIDATDKYKMKPQTSRAVCLQADDDYNQIDSCKVECEDEVDVFVWKICQKRKSKDGKKNEIELEMRTPRGPKIDIVKKETRAVQVIEEEFEDMRKAAKKVETVETANRNVKPTGKTGAAVRNQAVAKKTAPAKKSAAPTKAAEKKTVGRKSMACK